MKFVIDDASLLWAAINRVLRATPRNIMGTELQAICLETIDNKLYVHRYGDHSYAECSVDIELIEDGKVVVADATVFRFMTGRQEFHNKENKLYIRDLTNPKNNTDLLLSSTDPSFYSRISYEGIVTRPVTVDLAAGLWLTEDVKHLWGFGIIDGADIATTNSFNITLITNGEALVDGIAAVPAEFLEVAKIGTQLGQDGHKVWLIDPANSFAYYSTTVEKPFQKGYFRAGIENKMSESNARLTVNKEAFISLMEFISFMSVDNVYRNGYCQLQLLDGELTVSNINRTSGDATRTLSVTDSHLSFEVISYPRMLINAAKGTSEDEIVIEAWRHPDLDAYALLVMGESIINFIPCATRPKV